MQKALAPKPSNSTRLADFDDALWAAIAEPGRRRLIDLLSTYGERSASRLAADVPFSRQAVAKHMAVLQKVGMVHQRKQGKEVLFVLDEDELQLVSQMMREASARWERRLQRIKAIAEQLDRDP